MLFHHNYKAFSNAAKRNFQRETFKKNSFELEIPFAVFFLKGMFFIRMQSLCFTKDWQYTIIFSTRFYNFCLRQSYNTVLLNLDVLVVSLRPSIESSVCIWIRPVSVDVCVVDV